MSELDDIRARTEGHTPGPWEFDEDNIGSCYGRAYYGIITPSVYTTFGIRAAVAAEDYSPRGGGAREEECKGNAQLIAAAPDLLRIATEQEAELTQLRAERDRLRDALKEIRHTSIHYTQDGDDVHAIVDTALTQREGGEATDE